MLLRLFVAILLFFLLTTCDFKSTSNTTLQNIVLLDTVVDYTTVDVYPVLKNCNNCDNPVVQKICFENEFVKSLEKIVNKNSIRLENKIKDTVFVDILVNQKGEFQVSQIHASSLTKKQFSELDSILTNSVNLLSNAIQPAIKRGIPVNSMFKLPVVIQFKD